MGTRQQTRPKLPEGVRRLREGVFSLGREHGKTGSSVYFYTKDTMGTYGEPRGSPNRLGEIREGRPSNPHGIMSVKYALSKESYYPAHIKRKIRAMVTHLRRQKRKR